MIRIVRRSILLAIVLFGPVGVSHGAVSLPPRLPSTLAQSRVVVAGTVGRLDSYDDGRVTVGHVAPDRTIKGEPGEGDVLVVEEHDLPSSAPLLHPGERVVVFLDRARRTSALAKTLPAGPTYFRLVDGAAGLVGSPDAEAGREAGDLVARLEALATDGESDAATRAERARALAFDEVTARLPRLVADGAQAVAGLPSLATTLGDDERARLVRALQRTDLPDWARVALVDAVAEAWLTALAPTLRELDRPSPAVLAASWAALGRLGLPPTVDELARAASDPDPAIRAAVPAALLAAAGDAAIPRVEAIALHDAEPSVRRAAVTALGATKRETVVPSLERIYPAGSDDVRRACVQAYLEVGGRPAAESLARLVFDAPPDAQRMAVMGLLGIVAKDDPLVVRIRTTHPDPDLRDLLEHGPYLGHHHG